MNVFGATREYHYYLFRPLYYVIVLVYTNPNGMDSNVDSFLWLKGSIGKSKEEPIMNQQP